MLKFRIKPLLLWFAILCSISTISTWLYRTKTQYDVVQWIEANGGYVLYDFQMVADSDDITESNKKVYPPIIPHQMIDLFGYDWCCRVHGVFFTNDKKRTLEHLDTKAIPDLRTLVVWSSDRDPLYIDLSDLRCLEVLGASNMMINRPEQLEKLTHLRKLSIGRITGFPDEHLKKLDQLTSLEIYDCSPIEDYQFLKNMPKLKQLTLSNLQKEIKPSFLPEFKELKSLRISSPKLVQDLNSFPTTLESLLLYNVENIDFRGLSRLDSLKQLELSYCGIRELPKFTQNSALESVRFQTCLFNCNDSQLPLKGLSKATFVDCNFKNPKNISAFRDVQELFISNCLPVNFQAISEFPNLKRLTLIDVPVPNRKTVEAIPILESLHIDVEELDPFFGIQLLKSKPKIRFTGSYDFQFR